MGLLHAVAMVLHIGNEFLEVLGGKMLARHHGDRRVGGQPDRLEILDRIVADAGREHRRGDVRAHAGGQQRVAIGRRCGDARGSDRAAGTAHVLYDDRLIEHAAHAVGDDARHHVARPARRERHDQCDRAGRVILGARWRRQTRDANEQTDSQRCRCFAEFHLHLPVATCTFSCALIGTP